MERDKYHYRRCDNCGLKWIISSKVAKRSRYICPYCSNQQRKDEAKHDAISPKNKRPPLCDSLKACNANE